MAKPAFVHSRCDIAFPPRPEQTSALRTTNAERCFGQTPDLTIFVIPCKRQCRTRTSTGLFVTAAGPKVVDLQMISCWSLIEMLNLDAISIELSRSKFGLNRIRPEDTGGTNPASVAPPTLLNYNQCCGLPINRHVIVVELVILPWKPGQELHLQLNVF